MRASCPAAGAAATHGKHHTTAALGAETFSAFAALPQATARARPAGCASDFRPRVVRFRKRFFLPVEGRELLEEEEEEMEELQSTRGLSAPNPSMLGWPGSHAARPPQVHFGSLLFVDLM